MRDPHQVLDLPEEDPDGLVVEPLQGLAGQVAALLGVELTLSRRGDHVRLDGSRSDDQARGPINFTTNPGLLRIAFGRYLQSLDPDLEVNDGLLRNLADTEVMI